MGQRGFTLIEVLIVMAIMAILLAAGTIQFNEWSRKAAMEGEIKRLYMDLMQVRQEAVYTKRDRTVKLATGGYGYEIYSSNTTSVVPLARNSVPHKITWNGTGDKITFDLRGISSGQRSICIDQSSNPAAYDSIVVSQTRINMGKRNGDCKADDIQLK